MIYERTYDYKKEHKELTFVDGKGVVCTHCDKTVEEREQLPDYGVFMGSVWIKQNLPCEPYAQPKPIKTSKESGKS